MSLFYLIGDLPDKRWAEIFLRMWHNHRASFRNVDPRKAETNSSFNPMEKPQLDHIVIRLPDAETPEELVQYAEPFKKWFTLSSGGYHTGGKSQNVLISLPDGVYLELIAFTSTPPKDHRWAQRRPMNILDFAFLGHPERGKEEYGDGVPGGRGKCKWVVTVPKDEWTAGMLPFWCEDITPREIRVPKPETHPSGVTAVSRITVLVETSREKANLVAKYKEIIGGEDMTIGSPSGKDVTVDIRVAETKEEKEALQKEGHGIYKVEFNVPGITLCNPLFC